MGVDVVASIPSESVQGGYDKAVIKSPSDEREYQLVHLPNGFCALLIHDPKISNNDEEEEDEEEIRSLCYEEKLKESMDYLFKHTCLDISDKTYMSILNLCSNTKNLPQAMRVYAHLMQSKPILSSLLSDYIVVTLAKCGAIEDAITLAWKLNSLLIYGHHFSSF